MGLLSIVISFFAFIFGKDYSFTGLVKKIKVNVKTFVVMYVTKMAYTMVTTTTFCETHYYTIIIVCCVLGFVSVMIADRFQPQLTSLRVRFGYQEDPDVVAIRLQDIEDKEKASASYLYWSTACSYATAVAGGACVALTVAAVVATTSDKPKPKEIK
jgi:cytochrome c biogenesis protein CcdA